MPAAGYPLDVTYLGFANERNVLEMVENYFDAGADAKAIELAARFADEIFTSLNFYIEFYDFAKTDFETCCKLIMYLEDLLRYFDHETEADDLIGSLHQLINMYSGE